jgi:Family of unknown function (DUF5691)
MIDNLTRVALTGTSRQPNATVRTDLPVDSLLESLAEESAERRLLLAAGAAAVYRSAGQPLPPAAPATSAAAVETRPPCSAKMAQLLVDLVGTKQVELIVEAAQLLEQAGRRVPHDILPLLLAATDANLRKVLRPILGERARWLAPFNPDWLWAVNRIDELSASLSDLETVWNEGSLAARVAVLTRLHETQPQYARDWLSQVWPKEKAEPRAELLAAFGPSLTPDDEPFIENILDDRSMSVRTQAARLLARIPGSRLSRRMIARADVMVSYEAPKAGMLSKLKALAGAGGGKLIVEPPQEIDAAWERDGIPAKAPQGVGKRAYWLRLVLSLVPLSHWQQRLGVAPEALLSAARTTEWSETIVAAWTEAAQTFPDAGWRSALWNTWLDLFVDEDPKAGMQRQVLAGGVPAMLAVMPRSEAERSIVALLGSSAPIDNVIFVDCLRGLPKPWSPEVAHRCLVRLRQEAAASVTVVRQAAAAIMPIAARAIPPECFAQALTPWQQISGEHYIDKVWIREIAAFIETVQLRKTLIEETRS